MFFKLENSGSKAPMNFIGFKLNNINAIYNAISCTKITKRKMQL
jgi:hypothetical protein